MAANVSCSQNIQHVIADFESYAESGKHTEEEYCQKIHEILCALYSPQLRIDHSLKNRVEIGMIKISKSILEQESLFEKWGRALTKKDSPLATSSLVHPLISYSLLSNANLETKDIESIKNHLTTTFSLKQKSLSDTIETHRKFTMGAMVLAKVEHGLRNMPSSVENELREELKQFCHYLNAFSFALIKGEKLKNDSVIEFLSLVKEIHPWPARLDPIRIHFAKTFDILFKFVESPEKIRTLNLSRCGLKEVPHSISKLNGLKTLCLDDNQIKEIPAWVNDLQGLNELSLMRNRLTGEGIQCLKDNVKLTTLCLGGNNIPSVSFLHPSSPLECIDLSANGVCYFPETLLYLPELKKIDLAFNYIKTLPVDWHNLSSSLEHLDIAVNYLGEIDSVKNLSKLNFLHCAQNQLTTLPDLNNLPLISLYCANNGLCTLFELVPEGILKGTLSILDVTNNDLDSIPLSWSCLKRIEAIYASNNHIRQIPDNFISPKLKTLNLFMNQLTEIGECIYSFDAVWLGMNKLTALPSFNSLALAKKIRILNLSDNLINIFPEDILKNLDLQQLTLARNPLAQLPNFGDSFGTLKYVNICETSLSKEQQIAFEKALQDLHKKGEDLLEKEKLLKKTDKSSKSEIKTRKEKQQYFLNHAQTSMRSIRSFQKTELSGLKQTETWKLLKNNDPEKEMIKICSMALNGPACFSDSMQNTESLLTDAFEWKTFPLHNTSSLEISVVQTNGGSPYQQDGFCKHTAPLKSPFSQEEAQQLFNTIYKELHKSLENPAIFENEEPLRGAGAMAASVIVTQDQVYFSRVGDTCILAVPQEGINEALRGKCTPSLGRKIMFTQPQTWNSQREKLLTLHAQGIPLHLDQHWELRVDSLPTSHTLGDAYYWHEGCEASDIYHTTCEETPVLIVATDGLWDFFTPEDVLQEMYKAILHSGTTFTERKEKLGETMKRVDEILRILAFSRSYSVETHADNITIAHIFIKKPLESEVAYFSMFDGHDKRKNQAFVKYLERVSVNLFERIVSDRS